MQGTPESFLKAELLYYNANKNKWDACMGAFIILHVLFVDKVIPECSAAQWKWRVERNADY